MLKAMRGGRWKVDGGSIRRGFFFEDITPEEASAYADPAQWRFVFCPEGVTIGAVVTLDADGRVIWPGPSSERAR
jgi:hypothetical protein